MNATQRIMATLEGKPADRRAVAPVLSLYGARLTGDPMETYYRDPAAYARGQALVRERFEPDLLFGPFAFALIGEAFGSELHWFKTQPPTVRRPAAPAAGDWDRLAIPDPENDPRLAYLREAVRLMAAEHRGEVPIAMPLPPPIDLPALVMGMEGWIETVLFNPEGARRILDKTIPFFVRLANGLLEAGAALIAAPCAFASPAVVTREIAARFALPVLGETQAQLKGPFVLHHGGAPLLANLDLVAGLPRTVGYVVDERDDLERSRQILGPDVTLLSGPSAPRMGDRDAAGIARICRAMLENRRADPRFILSTTGPDVPWDAPPENIGALRLCAVECAESGQS